MVEVGQVVAGRYRAVRPIGAGGMSQVWLAVDQAGRRPVAIKQCAMPDGLAADEEELVRRWTIRDARALVRLDHPHVIRTFDVVPEGDQPWIVMEYVPSRSLRQIVDESGPLSPARAAGLGLAVLDGLNAAARAGLLHLDVKPGNVLIGDDGRMVLNDFGPVVSEQGISALAEAGIVLGSPNYIAPERLFDGVSTTQADLWSLGATLYYAVEGRPPFLRGTTDDILRALGEGRPDRTVLAGPLTGVLAGLLRRDPAVRLTSAGLETRLRGLAGRPAAVPPPRAPVAAAARTVPVEREPDRHEPADHVAAVAGPARHVASVAGPAHYPAAVAGPAHHPAAAAGPAHHVAAVAEAIRRQAVRTGSAPLVPGRAEPAGREAAPTIPARAAAGGTEPAGRGAAPTIPARAGAGRPDAAAIEVLHIEAAPVRRRVVLRRRAAVVATTVAVAAVLATAAAGAKRGDPVETGPAANPATQSRTETSPRTTFALPRGYRWWTDPSGIRVAVPSGWSRVRGRPGALRLTAPDGGPTLQISRWTPGSGSIVAGLLAAERDVGLTGYRRIRIETTPEPPGAVWEYTFRDARGGAMRGLQRVTTGGGQTYRIEWRAPRADWAAALPALDVALESFRPPPGA